MKKNPAKKKIKPFKPEYRLVTKTMFQYAKNEKDPDLKAQARYLRAEQKKNGVSPDECWDLTYALGIWMVPRMEMFIRDTSGYPNDFKDLRSWKRCLYKMLYFLKCLRDEDVPWDINKYPKFKAGYNAFRKHLLDLWW